MTFCVGIKVDSGLIGLADTRIVKGSEQASKSKVSMLEHATGPIFLMTSGLRSVRDKGYVYFEQELAAAKDGEITHMFEAANLFGAVLRRVFDEDGASLANSGYSFNLNAVLGGQLEGDEEPALLYVYPQGNWIAATEDAPYHVIGRTHYGKPILDRLLDPSMPLAQALALSFLAFDATRTSVIDVDFPIDVVVLDAATGRMRERRFDRHEMDRPSRWWHEIQRKALKDFPLEWADDLFGGSK